jgi:hypothetical protein
MPDWRMGYTPDRPDLGRRERSNSKEVTPCSEYTRFTAEGRFKDPFSDNSVIMDSRGMSILFPLGPYSKGKWSDRLGYGMAVVGEDTRIHLHANGKYVIRRALDRDHAEKVLSLLSTISRPTIFSTKHGKYLWEIIRDISLTDERSDEDLNGLINWELEDGDQVDIKNVVERFRELDERIGKKIDDISQNGGKIMREDISDDLDDIIECVKLHYSRLLSNEKVDMSILLGQTAYVIMVISALEI